MQTWRIIGKTLTLHKHEDIMLNSMNQTREKWDSLILSRADFGMEERCDGIPWGFFGIFFFFFFLNFFILFYFFLFRSNGIKEHLDKNDFRHGYSN